MAGRPVARVERGSGPPRASTRDTEPRTVVKRALEGENPRRAPTGGPSLARYWGRRGTDSRGEQSFEAGAPVTHRRAQRKWEAFDTCGALRCVEAIGLAVARNVRHGSCVPGPPSGGFERQRAGAERESDRESPAGAAPAAIGERTRKEASGPRERVRLPGKGKLWRGAPGTRAAWNKAAKRRGPRRTAESKRLRASREPAGTVERGKNPEDGTDEGLAILVPHVRPQGSA